jgi:hypothetical protein
MRQGTIALFFSGGGLQSFSLALSLAYAVYGALKEPGPVIGGDDDGNEHMKENTYSWAGLHFFFDRSG